MSNIHQKLSSFPEAIKNSLPRASSSVSSDLQGFVLNGEKSQVVFWEVKKGFSVEPHSHDHDEWGIIVSGYCILTVEGETKTYNAGEEFFIPGGKSHYCTMSDNYRSVDFFASPNWVASEK